MLPLLFFTCFCCVIAQTEFSLPPAVKWENTQFEGFVLRRGKNDHLVGTRGTLKYTVTPSGRVANRASFTFSDKSSPLDSLTLYQQNTIEMFDIIDGNCTEIINEAPVCNRWVSNNNKWTQSCTQRLSDKVANWTTVCTLDNNNRLSILSYTITYQGKPIASLDVYSTVLSSSPPSASDFVPSSSCGPSSTDPFDPASCIGEPLNMASKFKPGARATLLTDFSFVYEKRECTTFTGCGEWDTYDIPSPGSTGPAGKGTLWLKVTSSAILPTFVDRTSVYSSHAAYELGTDCVAVDKAKGTWKTDAYHNNIGGYTHNLSIGGSYVYLTGSLLANCGRFEGSVRGPVTNGAWTEYRAGTLISY